MCLTVEMTHSACVFYTTVVFCKTKISVIDLILFPDKLGFTFYVYLCYVQFTKSIYFFMSLKQSLVKLEGWEDIVTIVSCDMRNWDAPEKADILVALLPCS